MKTNIYSKFLMLLAVMMLTSVCIFAQNKNNRTLKGDVNEDGQVDISDVVTLVNIIVNNSAEEVQEYFYFGTTQPTVEEYNQGEATTFTSLRNAAGTTVSVTSGETLYLLCPESWTTNKTLKLEDESGNKYDFSEIVDNTTIPGYVIYQTKVWENEATLTLKVYDPFPLVEGHYYVIQNDPGDIYSYKYNQQIEEDGFALSTDEGYGQSDYDKCSHIYTDIIFKYEDGKMKFIRDYDPGEVDNSYRIRFARVYGEMVIYQFLSRAIMYYCQDVINNLYGYQLDFGLIVEDELSDSSNVEDLNVGLPE